MWNSKKESLCVVCDVGSSSVSAALVLFSSDKKTKPKILFTTFVPISVTLDPDLVHLGTTIGGYVKTAFATLAKEGMIELKAKNIKVTAVEKVFASLSSPWFVSKTAKRQIANNKPFTFDEHLISTTLKEEEQSFETSTLESAPNLSGLVSGLGRDMRMIEREVIAVSLNGYPTQNPFGRSANVADVSLYMSLAPEKLLQEIRGLAGEYFHHARGVFHTFPLISFGALSEMFANAKEYIFFDIAGEYSHLFLAKGGTIQSTASFPLGENSLLRLLMTKGTDEALARSTIALSKEGAASGELQSQTGAIVAGYRNNWVSECKKALQELGGTASHWFLIADESVEVQFASFLRTVVAEGAPASAITTLGTADFKESVDIEKHVERDPYLALQTLFASIHGDLFS